LPEDRQLIATGGSARMTDSGHTVKGGSMSKTDLKQKDEINRQAPISEKIKTYVSDFGLYWNFFVVLSVIIGGMYFYFSSIVTKGELQKQLDTQYCFNYAHNLINEYTMRTIQNNAEIGALATEAGDYFKQKIEHLKKDNEENASVVNRANKFLEGDRSPELCSELKK
jgi:hypothetical protein